VQNIMAIWTYETALVLIRALSKACLQAGYFVSVAGSVLIDGSSDNDLDLLIIPRTDVETDPTTLLKLLSTTFTQQLSNPRYLKGRTIFHVAYNGKPVDITIFNPI
jgi:hypothetical protein